MCVRGICLCEGKITTGDRHVGVIVHLTLWFVREEEGWHGGAALTFRKAGRVQGKGNIHLTHAEEPLLGFEPWNSWRESTMRRERKADIGEVVFMLSSPGHRPVLTGEVRGLVQKGPPELCGGICGVAEVRGGDERRGKWRKGFVCVTDKQR